MDTGATLSLTSEMTLKELWPDMSFSATTVTLCSYSGETIPVLGSIDTELRYKGQRACLTLLVVRGTGPSLIGKNWMECLKIYGLMLIVLIRKWYIKCCKSLILFFKMN